MSQEKLWVSPTTLLHEMGGRSCYGAIEVVDGLNVSQEVIPEGEYTLFNRKPTSTGELLHIEHDGKPYAIKTNLDPKHGFLHFEKRHQRAWSLLAEHQTASKPQLQWDKQDRIHLGVVGVVENGGNCIEITELNRVKDDAEPGLLMRLLPDDDNGLRVLTQAPDRFESKIVDIVSAILAMEEPVDNELAFRLGGADGILNWIDGGNLNLLRNHMDPDIRTYANTFWEQFQRVIEANRQSLDQRARTPGTIVRGSGDTKILNMFFVNGRVGLIDPITLLLKDNSDQGFDLAPWPIRDRLSELAYATVYLNPLVRMGMLNDQQGQRINSLMVHNFMAECCDDASRNEHLGIWKLHSAALGSVEAEVTSRLAETIQDPTEKGFHLALAQQLRVFSMIDLMQAKSYFGGKYV